MLKGKGVSLVELVTLQSNSMPHDRHDEADALTHDIPEIIEIARWVGASRVLPQKFLQFFIVLEPVFGLVSTTEVKSVCIWESNTGFWENAHCQVCKILDQHKHRDDALYWIYRSRVFTAFFLKRKGRLNLRITRHGRYCEILAISLAESGFRGIVKRSFKGSLSSFLSRIQMKLVCFFKYLRSLCLFSATTTSWWSSILYSSWVLSFYILLWSS